MGTEHAERLRTRSNYLFNETNFNNSTSGQGGGEREGTGGPGGETEFKRCGGGARGRGGGPSEKRGRAMGGGVNGHFSLKNLDTSVTKSLNFI